jgi:hypothetical protein
MPVGIAECGSGLYVSGIPLDSIRTYITLQSLINIVLFCTPSKPNRPLRFLSPITLAYIKIVSGMLIRQK